MKLKAIFVNVDILQTLILKSVVFAHEQLSADWYGQVFADTTRTPPSTARRTTSACNTSDYRRRLPPTLSSTSFVALFTSKAKRLLLCWCVLWPLKLNEHSKIIFFFPLLVTKIWNSSPHLCLHHWSIEKSCPLVVKMIKCGLVMSPA